MNPFKILCRVLFLLLVFTAGPAFPETTVYMLVEGLEGPLEDGSFELIEFD